MDEIVLTYSCKSSYHYVFYIADLIGQEACLKIESTNRQCSECRTGVSCLLILFIFKVCPQIKTGEGRTWSSYNIQSSTPVDPHLLPMLLTRKVIYLSNSVAMWRPHIQKHEVVGDISHSKVDTNYCV